MSVHLLLPWLFITAALGQSDLGVLGVVVTLTGFAGLIVAILASVRKPAWSLLFLVLPIAVTNAFMQVVGVWLIGDQHEAATLSLYAVSLLAALAIAGYASRANRLAVAGATIFALAYAFIAFEASLFVFWTGLH